MAGGGRVGAAIRPKHPTLSDVGRNDPCPCGSGKKYRKCCLDPTAPGTNGVQTFVTPDMRRLLWEEYVWEAGVVPVAAALEDDPASRPGAAMVTAGGLVLASEVLARAPAEPEEVARLLARELAARMARDLTGRPEWDETRPLSMPETWAGWGLPRWTVAGLFAAAAAYWRAEPWVRLPNERLLELTMPDGRVWTAGVLGHAGLEFGLALYQSRDDFLDLLNLPKGAHALGMLHDRVLSLTYEPRPELPRPMQREVAGAGWKVATPEAYPVPIAMNTPGGGIGRRDAAHRREAVPVSLERFFTWLEEERRIHCPWALEVLEERDHFRERLETFPGGFWWADGVQGWQAEHWEKLDHRVMLHDPSLGAASEWGVDGPLGSVMGPEEYGLDRELGRRWLIWRDEELRAGTTDPDRLRAALIGRQRAWERSPHPAHDGRTPEEVVLEERERREEG